MTNTRKTAKWLWLPLALAGLAASLALPFSAQAATEADSGRTTASVVFSQGNLQLDAAPVLDFGDHTIDVGEPDYASQGAGNIRVTDARGTGDGWRLTVRLSPFDNAGNITLRGAKITVEGATVTPYGHTVGTPPTVSPVLTINTDNQDVTVLSAEQHAGRGVWDSAWPADGTTLVTKPGTADLGTSTAIMLWSLQDAP